jgi:hypothetical protein
VVAIKGSVMSAMAMSFKDFMIPPSVRVSPRGGACKAS